MIPCQTAPFFGRLLIECVCISIKSKDLEYSLLKNLALRQCVWSVRNIAALSKVEIEIDFQFINHQYFLFVKCTRVKIVIKTVNLTENGSLILKTCY